MAAHIIPQVGMRGLFELQAPFNTLLTPQTPYQCVAVRRLEDIVAAGDDPQAIYYTDHGLDGARYQADLAAGACIISLRASEGSWVYVPSTFIARMPEQGGVSYTTMMLAISLGALPDSLDLTFLKSQVLERVKSILGVNAEATEVVVSTPTQLSQAEHTAVEASRALLKTNSPTNRSLYLKAAAERDAAVQKVTELEAYVKNWILTHP